MKNLAVLMAMLLASTVLFSACDEYVDVVPIDERPSAVADDREDDDHSHDDDDYHDEDHDHEDADAMSALQLVLLEDAANDNISVTYDDDYIYLESNSLPDHETGDFPNRGNPNAISEIDASYKIARNPQYVSNARASKIFGVTLGGVSFDPGTAEKDAETGWSIEAFQDLMDLGIDLANAHVQPSGKYHYHGIPEVLVDGYAADEHSPLIGFAADGHPIYVRYGNVAAGDLENPGYELGEHTSSYRLKDGERADGEPDGQYDGTYTNDFEYIAGYGTLDDCNGVETVTPEYPEGTYAYFLTDSFPYVPRCHHGVADSSFEEQPGGMMGGGPGGAGMGPGPGGMPPR